MIDIKSSNFSSEGGVPPVEVEADCEVMSSRMADDIVEFAKKFLGEGGVPPMEVK